jgi:hypothetical protein
MKHSAKCEGRVGEKGTGRGGVSINQCLRREQGGETDTPREHIFSAITSIRPPQRAAESYTTANKEPSQRNQMLSGGTRWLRDKEERICQGRGEKGEWGVYRESAVCSLSKFGIERTECSDIHDGTTLTLGEGDELVVAESDSPHGLARLGEFANEDARLVVEQLDLAIVAASDYESLVELEARDRVVVSAEPVEAFECREAKDDHATV